jgi:hypothetical protein
LLHLDHFSRRIETKSGNGHFSSGRYTEFDNSITAGVAHVIQYRANAIEEASMPAFITMKRDLMEKSALLNMAAVVSYVRQIQIGLLKYTPTHYYGVYGQEVIANPCRSLYI